MLYRCVSILGYPRQGRNGFGGGQDVESEVEIGSGMSYDEKMHECLSTKVRYDRLVMDDFKRRKR